MPTLAGKIVSIPMFQSIFERPYPSCPDAKNFPGPLLDLKKHEQTALKRPTSTITDDILHLYRTPVLALRRIDLTVTSLMDSEREACDHTTVDLMLPFKEKARNNHHWCASAVLGQLDMIRYVLKHPDTPDHPLPNHPFHELVPDLLLIEVSPPLQQRTQITPSTNTPYSLAHRACLVTGIHR